MSSQDQRPDSRLTSESGGTARMDTGFATRPVAPSRAGHGIGTLGMIWAQDQNGLLGAGGGMVWHVPADFKHFKATTVGHSVIMGRTSFEALGAPLPQRRNIVLTRQAHYQAPGIEVAPTLEAALELVAGEDLVWIAGGAQVYAEAMDIADLLVVSYLDLAAEVPAAAAAAWAPPIDPAEWTIDAQASDAQWREVSGDGAWRVVTYRRADLTAGAKTGERQ